MAAIAPFRGLRYNLDQLGRLAPVLAPPYDVISPEEQEQLYAASPYNVVRLVYGKPCPDDTPTANRYTRAKEALEAWRSRQVLVRDPQPAFYLYEHAFAWEGRTFRRLGVIGLLDFSAADQQQVLRHEATFAAPKADRTQLLDAVQAQLSPVFCLAPDPEGRVRALLEEWTRQPPLAEAQVAARLASEEGQPPAQEAVRLWVVAQPQQVQALQALLRDRRVLIADGHHRFEVALSRRHLCSGVMTFFACLEDPAVVMRPIHRTVRRPSALPAQAMRQRLESLCELQPCPDRASVSGWLDAAEAPGQFGYYEAGRWHRALVRDAALAQWLAQAPTPPLARLDVAMLHGLILPQVMGESLASATADGSAHNAAQAVRYTPQMDVATGLVDRGEADGAWLLRPMPVSQVFDLAGQGLAMPQKSTFFYPKVPSGLVINPFDAAP